MAESSSYIVVDIGGTKIRLAYWDGLEISEVESFETPQVSALDFVSILVKSIKNKMLGKSIKGVGVSTAGPIDVVNGAILNPANLGNADASWRRFEIKKHLIENLNIPICVDNDAAMTAFGQYMHCEKQKLKDLAVLTIGTGIGVGVIVNGSLVRAGQSMHPEFGHFLMADHPRDDYQTPFADYPTLESFVSGYHFSKRVGILLGREIDGGELIELSEKQDEKLMTLWDEYARRMAVAISNLYLVYFPKKVVLAGGFALVSSPFFLAQSRRLLADILKGRVDAGMPLPEVEVSVLHDELPLYGAGYKIQLEVDSK